MMRCLWDSRTGNYIQLADLGHADAGVRGRSIGNSYGFSCREAIRQLSGLFDDAASRQKNVLPAGEITRCSHLSRSLTSKVMGGVVIPEPTLNFH
jgi:hypothetical protein